MCGRFAQSKPVIEYAHALDPAWEPPPLDLTPTWNMAPSRQVLVFHESKEGRVAEFLRWGFLPSWAEPDAQKPINARVESASSKPYFRHAWKSGRCLIPADGWYEWQVTSHGKQPCFIHRSDNQPVLLAGLYEFNPQVNTRSFTILTTEAKGALREVHEREPLALSSEAGREWIHRDLAAARIKELVSEPLGSEHFSWYAISTRVNSPRNDGPELLTPA
jgi:putative SOS response-associated peptidase YedK